jgi:glutamine amidotransferase
LDQNKADGPYNEIKNNSMLYFVHSYYVVPKNKNYIATTTNYKNIEFTSSIIKDNVFATQFHPEKSGVLGLKVLDNFFKK